MDSYYYLDVSLVFSENYESEVTPAYFKKNIVESLYHLFGEVGAAIPIDVLKYESYTRRAIIRFPIEHYVKVRSSLTLVHKYEGAVATYKVHQGSSFLISLSGNSRDYEH